MNNIRGSVKSVVGVTVVFALLLAAGGFATLKAQSPPNPFDVILTKLDQIITILTAPPPPTGLVTLSTPSVLMTEAEGLLCALVNVGTEPLSVHRRILNEDGEAISDLVYTSLAPGNSRYAGVPLPDIGFYRCEFTFAGPANALRANLLVVNLSVNYTRMSVEAR